MTLVDVDSFDGYLFDGKYVIHGLKDVPQIAKVVRCYKCKWAKRNEFNDYDCTAHIPIFRVLGCGFCYLGEERDVN